MKVKVSAISIYINKDANEQTKYASTELMHYLSLMSGEIIETTAE